MDNPVEEIKAKIDITSFINEYVPLKKTGRNFKVLCPFHAEKTPSFIVSPERQIWHCFGACGEGGDIFKFLMKWENIDFPEALKILAKRAGVRLTVSPSLTEAQKIKEKILEINHLASEFYHYLLLKHRAGKKALDYVSGRGLSSRTIVEFKIGYAPNQWRALYGFLKKKGYSEAEILKAGLIIKSSKGGFYDRFRGRLIFPLKDSRGNIIGFSGRFLLSNVKEAKYINSPETAVYKKREQFFGLDSAREAIKKENRAIIVEGEFDLLSSYEKGIKNVVAIKGTALTENQVNLIKRYTENILLALDVDLAGNEAAKRGIEIADKAGLNINVIKLLKGKDPDECVRAGIEFWKKSIEKAVPIFDFIIDSAFSRFSGKTAIEKKRISEEVVPFLAKITSPVVRAHYVKELAQKLDIPEESIALTIAEVKKEKEPMEIPRIKKGKREELVEEHLLSLILQTGKIVEGLSPTDFENKALARIFSFLEEYFKSEKKFNIKDFAKKIPEELVSLVDKLYVTDLEEILADKKFLDKEIERTVKEIKKLSLVRQLKECALLLKAKDGDEKACQKLEKKFTELSQELKKMERLYSNN